MAVEIVKITWKEKETGKLYDIDTDRMRKEEASVKGVRLPWVLDKDEVFLYNSGWENNGENYIIVNKKYLKEVK